MKSKLQEIYQEYGHEPDRNYEWEKHIYALAKRYPQEYQTLIKLFHEEKDTFFKLNLGRILAKLGEQSIKNDLVSILNMSQLDIDEQYSAAVNLLYLNYHLPSSLFEKFIEEGIPTRWISRSLYEINTPLSLSILRELFLTNEEMKEIIPYLSEEKKQKLNL